WIQTQLALPLPAGALHFDHIRAHIRKQPGCVWALLEAREVEHADPAECTHSGPCIHTIHDRVTTNASSASTPSLVARSGFTSTASNLVPRASPARARPSIAATRAVTSTAARPRPPKISGA